MHKNKKHFLNLKYFILMSLSIVRIVIIFFVPILVVLKLVSGVSFSEQSGWKSADTVFYILCGISWILFYYIKDILENMQGDIRNERDFDEETGLSKKYNSYQKLSKSEREQIDKQRLADVERLIGTGALKKMTKNGSVDPEKDLKNLIGLNNVKQNITEMAARMEFDKKAKKAAKTARISSLHMCFMGPPGTGKTTCAKIMTGFLYKYGYLKQNKYIETDGNFLKGYNQGETSEKTALLLTMSKGKVLFIDEAYALFSGKDAQEAIATIIKAMEDDRDSFVLILAGYESEMNMLIDSNPVFFSRIGHILYFGNYTDEELCNIFSSMANAHNFYVPYETLERFSKRIRIEKKHKNFGNARTCRNILDESISKHALNLKKGIIKKNNTYTICPQDIIIKTP